MNILPKVKAATTNIGDQVERIRLYRDLALQNDIHTLSPAARRVLGLID
ncbi:hypothetical protein [Pelagibacterium halotolerans]|uniref:Uncharacterized protein n=1 Tax=Pelagibacterium halotolerans (strain DSM 22347 / JCM 15775 / CGMCC 1.7692 / B2) TaxID=1082931 RepID=G4R8W9_PELHB|nr:hypothetical protein [Pelagibacterium halotolerans]AEQ51386.1 hypothetical protein KKY_1364 [Pelagibacterium halotolerans B2]QJR18771.1 hypothetical protein HKM20_10155 [Pelagibacterium halotolerans]SEA92546.1 hypothetical protein SAMN05428936_1133 [Pelagibacterium halotolerans]